MPIQVNTSAPTEDLGIFESIGRSVLAGREQKKNEVALRKGYMFTGNRVTAAPKGFSSGTQRDAQELFDVESPVQLADPVDRFLAAEAAADSYLTSQAVTQNAAKEAAEQRAAEGDTMGMLAALASDPVGAIGAFASEQIARSPMNTMLGFIPLVGSRLASLRGEFRSGFAGEINSAILERGGDPSNPEDVYNALSDKELLQEAALKTSKRASATANTENLVELLSAGVSRFIPNDVLKGITRFGAEGVGEGTGALAGDIAAGEDINIASNLLEGLSAVGQSAATTLGTTAIEQAAKTRNEQDVEEEGPSEGVSEVSGSVFDQPRLGQEEREQLRAKRESTPVGDLTPEQQALLPRDPTGEIAEGFVRNEAEKKVFVLGPQTRKAARAAVDTFIKVAPSVTPEARTDLSNALLDFGYTDLAAELEAGQPVPFPAAPETDLLSITESHGERPEGFSLTSEMVPNIRFVNGRFGGNEVQMYYPQLWEKVQEEASTDEQAYIAEDTELNGVPYEMAQMDHEQYRDSMAGMEIVGGISFTTRDKYVKIGVTGPIAGWLRSQGIGQLHYKALVDYAFQINKPLSSDFSVSKEAGRAYTSLARQGYEVYINKERRNNGNGFSASRPVYMIVRDSEGNGPGPMQLGENFELQYEPLENQLYEAFPSMAPTKEEEAADIPRTIQEMPPPQDITSPSIVELPGRLAELVQKAKFEPLTMKENAEFQQLQSAYQARWDVSKVLWPTNFDNINYGVRDLHSALAETGAFDVERRTRNIEGEKEWTTGFMGGTARVVAEAFAHPNPENIGIAKDALRDLIGFQINPPEDIGRPNRLAAQKLEELVTKLDALAGLPRTNIDGNPTQEDLSKAERESIPPPSAQKVNILFDDPTTGETHEAFELLIKANFDPTEENRRAAYNAVLELISAHVEAGNDQFAQQLNEQYAHQLFGEEPPPAPPEDTAIPSEEFDNIQGLTSLSRAEMTRLRNRLNMDDLPAPTRRQWAAALRMADTQGLIAGSEQFAQELISEPRSLNDYEVAALLAGLAQAENAFDSLSERARVFGEEGNRAQAIRIEELAQLEKNRINTYQMAAALTGSEDARALAIRQAFYNRSTDRLSRLLRSGENLKGAPLTDTERSKTIEMAAQLQKQDERIAALERKVVEQVSAKKERIANKVVKDTAKEETRADISEQRRKEINAARDEIKRQLNSLGFRINSATGLSAEAAYLVGKLAKTYVEEGVVSLGDVVHKILQTLPDLNRDQALEGILAMDKELIKRTEATVRAQLKQIRTQAEVVKEIDQRLREGEDPSDLLEQLQASTLDTVTDNQRLIEVQEKIQEIQDLIDKGVEPPTRRQEEVVTSPELLRAQALLRDLRGLLRVKRQIAGFEQQLRTGIYDKRTEPKRRLRTPASRELEEAYVQRALLEQRVRRAQGLLKPFNPKDPTQLLPEIARTSRTLLTTGDVSGLLRQGLALFLVKPSAIPKTVVKGIQSYFSSHTTAEIDIMIRNHPDFLLMEEFQTWFPTVQNPNIAQAEEAFWSRLANHFPPIKEALQGDRLGTKIGAVLTGPVRGAERSMVTTGNLLRFALMKEFLERDKSRAFEVMGRDKQGRAIRRGEVMARFVNEATGRGTLKIETAKMLENVLFSTYFTASRFQHPARTIQMLKDPVLRKYAVRQILGFTGLGLSILSIAAMSGAEVGTDPEDSDFGRLVIGNVRIDLWGGFQQPISLVLRVLTGARKAQDPLKKHEVNLFQTMMNFGLFRLHPAITVPFELMQGKDVIGQDVTPLETLYGSTLTLFLQDAVEVGKEEGFIPGVGAGVLASAGVSISAYGDELNAGDIKPLLKKIDFQMNPPQYSEPIRANRKMRENLDDLYAAIAAQQIRNDYNYIKMLADTDPEEAKEHLRQISQDARDQMREFTDTTEGGQPAFSREIVEELKRQEEALAKELR